MTRRPRWFRAGLTALAVGCGSACSPALDWREFTPEGTDIVVSFPCRPDRQARPVVVAGAQSRMEMLACSAGGTTFALAYLDVADPARVGAALVDLRATAIANLQGTDARAEPLQIKGMTPNAQAALLSIAGQRPGGAGVRAQAGFFARGLRVYQASVVGAEPASPAPELFFGALKFGG